MCGPQPRRENRDVVVPSPSVPRHCQHFTGSQEHGFGVHTSCHGVHAPGRKGKAVPGLGAELGLFQSECLQSVEGLEERRPALGDLGMAL